METSRGEWLPQLARWCQTGDGNFLRSVPSAFRETLLQHLEEMTRSDPKTAGMVITAKRVWLATPPRSLSPATIILGPSSVTHHLHPNGKEVYIFGEYHQMETGGIGLGIDLFLVHLLRELPICLDLFFESQESENNLSLYPTEGWISQIEYRLGLCFPPYRDRCPYPTLRAHLLDWRHQFPFLQFAVPMMYGLGLPDFELVRETMERFPHYERLFDEVYDASSTDRVVRRILETDLYQKQLRLIPDREIARRLVSLILETPRYDLRPFLLTPAKLGALRQLVRRDSDRVRTELHRAFVQIVARSTPPFDLYALARLFRRYKSWPHEPHRSIFYVGEFHAEVYRDVLTRLGYSEVERSIGLKGKVDVSHFQPFFKN